MNGRKGIGARSRIYSIPLELWRGDSVAIDSVKRWFPAFVTSDSFPKTPGRERLG